jgi:hypothetical protein
MCAAVEQFALLCGPVQALSELQDRLPSFPNEIAFAVRCPLASPGVPMPTTRIPLTALLAICGPQRPEL